MLETLLPAAGPPERECARWLCARLEDALAGDVRAARRLGAAGTTVTIWVGGDEAATITLLLDRRPPVVRAGPEPAEIVIELSHDQACAFGRGRLTLPTAILDGDVGCSGPVRKYLTVDPIVRGLLSRVD